MKKVYISEPNKLIVLPPSDFLANTFPELVKVGKYVGLPHDIRNTAVLRKFGYDVPSPMTYQYDFPNHLDQKPFKTQVVTCDLVTSNQRAYVLNDMGTGKTRAALWSWDFLNQKNLAKKVLILSTLSNLRVTWGSEIISTLPNRVFEILHGSKDKRFERLANKDAEIFILNHDGVGIMYDELIKRTDIDVLIVDELAKFRNNSDRSKFVRKLARRMVWVWGLTGSPMPRKVTDVWGQAKVVTPDNPAVPKYFSHCRSELMIQKGPHFWVPKADAIDKAYTYLQPSVRFSLDDVVELPELINDLDGRPPGTPIQLSPEQDRVYKALSTQLSALARDKKITAANAAVALNKLVQVAGGWVYSADGGWVDLGAKQRIERVVDIIDSTSRKVLLFVPFRHAIEGLAKELAANDIDFAVVHGGVSAKVRDKTFVKFQQTDSIKVLVAHPETTSHGLTLTAADTTIWYSPVTSYETYEQANARFRRVGQRHKQRLYHLTGTKAEAHLYELLNKKRAQQDNFLMMFKEEL